jgi:glycosyltransferase involved in cell wall biosynthesis
VIGAPLYNKADYLPTALDSLLAQSDSDFALLLVDDLSTDATPAIARQYARLDPRVVYQRNEVRLGLVGNWRRCFELARERYPMAQYFAWGSDHDVWHPSWLERLVAVLEERPEAVLAYPVTARIRADGEFVLSRSGRQAIDMPCKTSRLRATCGGIHAGDAVYGLHRSDSLERAGALRPVLEPDRLLLAELAIQGEFRLVDDVLWQRRFVKTAVRARQRRAIFPGRRPLYSWLSPWAVRATVFLWVYGIRAAGHPHIRRREGLLLGKHYALATSGHMVDRIRRRWLKRWRRTCKRMARTRKMMSRRWLKRRKRARKRVARLRKTAIRMLSRTPRTMWRRTKRLWRHAVKKAASVMQRALVAASAIAATLIAFFTRAGARSGAPSVDGRSRAKQDDSGLRIILARGLDQESRASGARGREVPSSNGKSPPSTNGEEPEFRSTRHGSRGLRRDQQAPVSQKSDRS